MRNYREEFLVRSSKLAALYILRDKFPDEYERLYLIEYKRRSVVYDEFEKLTPPQNNEV